MRHHLWVEYLGTIQLYHSPSSTHGCSSGSGTHIVRFLSAVHIMLNLGLYMAISTRSEMPFGNGSSADCRRTLSLVSGSEIFHTAKPPSRPEPPTRNCPSGVKLTSPWP